MTRRRRSRRLATDAVALAECQRECGRFGNRGEARREFPHVARKGWIATMRFVRVRLAIATAVAEAAVP